MKIEELEKQIENEARTDYDWKDVLNIIDYVKDILVEVANED